jgi:hypothetical protein
MELQSAAHFKNRSEGDIANVPLRLGGLWTRPEGNSGRVVPTGALGGLGGWCAPIRVGKYDGV